MDDLNLSQSSGSLTLECHRSWVRSHPLTWSPLPILQIAPYRPVWGFLDRCHPAAGGPPVSSRPGPSWHTHHGSGSKG